MQNFMQSYIWLYIHTVDKPCPILLYIWLYIQTVDKPCLIYKLTKRSANQKLGRSKVISSVNAQFTKTAIIVTVVFCVSLSFDSWYYVLGCVGLTSYVYGSSLQIVSAFLTVINSFANPLIYAASMSAFRRTLLNTFRCRNNNVNVLFTSRSKVDSTEAQRF